MMEFGRGARRNILKCDPAENFKENNKTGSEKMTQTDSLANTAQEPGCGSRH